ncbi:MAG: hypothetical protein PF517_13895 [Salinivirgaceae bacterium]|jgi:hypothetical protein|nr:hypothetical protein [Salinivirgaceae bacterium]
MKNTNTVGVAAPNYGKRSFVDNAIAKVTGIITRKARGTKFQFWLYKSYWHSKIAQPTNNADLSNIYMSGRPNYGAGIGHQLANWNSGLYHSGIFKLKFAHYPFSSPKWEKLFGFGEGEPSVYDLTKNKGYKLVRLPWFEEFSKEDTEKAFNIIKSYSGKKVVFLLDTDQGYKKQFETRDILQAKFYKATARSNDNIVLNNEYFNIAVHIRPRMAIETDIVWEKRGLDNIYFSKVLDQVLALCSEKNVKIYLFSQGNKANFPEFDKYKNITYCLDMNPYDSVVNMVYADCIISSKSSFSYKPALISNGIKICPSSFWHRYPNTNDFILVDNDSIFDIEKLKKQLLL